MKIHLPSILDTRKKKAGAILLTGVLITALGTGAAFAANATNAGQSLMASYRNRSAICDRLGLYPILRTQIEFLDHFALRVV